MENTTSNTSQDNNSKSQNEEIGAFWKRTSRNNMTYLAGHIEVQQPDGTKTKEKVVVFSNQNKQKDNQPDYRVYISNSTPREGGEGQGGGNSQQAAQSPEAEDLL